MIGERIKHARKRKGMSLRHFASKVGVSAQSISNYERGIDHPGSAVLIRLAQALEMPVEFFLRASQVKTIQPVFRKKTTSSKRKMESQIEEIRDWVERYLEIESLLEVECPFQFPDGFPKKIDSLDQVEHAVEALRDQWGIGTDAIANLTSLLEEKGILVGVLACDDDKLEGCAFWVENSCLRPVIALRDGAPGDRQRFTLAHELAHLLLEPSSSLDEEKIANRFAGAFLVPAEAARSMLGSQRGHLDLRELYFLKQTFGLSMAGWIYRALDLNIISEARFKQELMRFSKQGWRKQEPFDPYSREEPQRMKRLVWQLVAEEIISEKRAKQLLGDMFEPFPKSLRTEQGGAEFALSH